MKNLYFFSLLVLSICSLGMSGGMKTQQSPVIVPNVEGITLEIAAQTLRTVGLQPRFQSSSNLSAIVVGQHPRPGVSLPMGGEVFLSTNIGTEPTQSLSTTRTLRQTPAVSTRSGITPEGVSTSNIAGATVHNTGTNVSITPLQTPQQSSQVSRSPTSLSAGQSTILYQPPQRAASQYFIAETKPRFYPAWYPRRFVSQSTAQSIISQTSAESVKIAVQPQIQSQVTRQASISAYSVLDTEPQAYLSWYPKKFLARQESSQSQIVLSQEGQQQKVEIVQPSTTYAVPVPNLLRLRREDALFAITKAGLSVGNISLVQSSQERAGIVLKQSPRARAIVPAGTRVDLWIVN
jgi:beta-lactam-binding protein with PASTA domain